MHLVQYEKVHLYEYRTGYTYYPKPFIFVRVEISTITLSPYHC